MTLALASLLGGGYLLALGFVLLFAVALGRAAKHFDEAELRHRRAEASRRRLRGLPG